MPSIVGFTIQASIGNAEEVFNKLKSGVTDFESALGAAGKTAESFATSLAGGVAGGILVADSLKKVGQAAADMAGQILDAGRALQDSTAQLQAWGNLTAEQASKVSQAFINMGQPIEQSAAQLTQALANVIPQLEIINQGALSAGQAVAFMSAANDAAVATGQKLDDVTRGLSQSMLTFGVSLGDAKEAAGTLVATSELTGSSIEQLTTNMGRLHDRFGPLAPDLKETASFLEELNQAGASGSRGLLVAATSIDHLLGSSKDVKLGLEELGISITDDSGKMKSWGQLFPEIVAGLSQITDDAKRARLENETLGGSWEALDQVVRRGTQGIADANSVVDDHSNFEQQAAIRANTFSGQLEILGKNAENVTAQLGGIVAGPGTEVLKWMNDAIKSAGDLSSKFGEGLKDFEVSGVVQALDNVIGKVKDLQSLLTLHIEVPIPAGLKGIADALDTILGKYNALPSWLKGALAGGSTAGPLGALIGGIAGSSPEHPTTQQFPSSNPVIESSPDIKASTADAKDNAEAFNRTTAQWIAFEEQMNPTASKLEAVNIAIAATTAAGTTNQAAIDGLAAEHDKLTAAATNSAEAATASAKAAEIGGRPLTAQAYKDLATALDSTNEKQIAGARAALTIAEAQDAANTKFGKEGVSAVNAYAEAQKQAENAVTSLATAQRALDEAEGGRGVNTVPSAANVQTAADAIGPTRAAAEAALQVQQELTQQIVAAAAAGNIEQVKLLNDKLSSAKQDATEEANAYKQAYSDELTALHQLQAAESSRHDAAISEAQQERQQREQQLQVGTTLALPTELVTPQVKAGLIEANNATIELAKNLSQVNDILQRTDLTPAQRESFTNWKNELIKGYGEAEAKVQEFQKIASMPTEQEKTVQVNVARIGESQSELTVQKDTLNVIQAQNAAARALRDQGLDAAILGAEALKNKFEESLAPLRDMEEQLSLQKNIVSTIVDEIDQGLTAAGLTQQTDLEYLNDKLRVDQARAAGGEDKGAEKALQTRGAQLDVFRDQANIEEAGLKRQEAALQIQQDGLKIEELKATLYEKENTNIDGVLRDLNSEKGAREISDKLADQILGVTGKQLDAENAVLGKLNDQYAVYQKQLEIKKLLAQPTQEGAAGGSGQSSGPNRIGVPSAQQISGGFGQNQSLDPTRPNYVTPGGGGVIGYPASANNAPLTINLNLNSKDIGHAAANEIYNGLTLNVGTAP